MDKTAIDLSKLPFIDDVISLKQEIDSNRPIAKDVDDKIFQKLKLDWNYNSNAIEGNKLNYGETVAFIMHGITAKGKTLKDHLDIKGHNEAIGFLLSIIKEERDISESDIRALHTLILVEEYESDAITQDGFPTKKTIKLGTYKTTPNSVKTRTGEMHYYASPDETPLLMADLMQWYDANKSNSEIHPIVLASLFHFKFVAIHPFDDGNGRLARILMNLILMRNNYPVVVVKNEDKSNYYGVLAQADNQQFIPLVEYMSELLQHSLNIYLKGIKGECIEEESDIDKEIALLKKNINENVLERKGRNFERIKDVLSNSIFQTIISLEKKFIQIEELFFENNKTQNSDVVFHRLDDSSTFLDIVNTELTNKSAIDTFIYSLNNNNEYHYSVEYFLLRLKNNINFSEHERLVINFWENNYEIKSKKYIISKYYNEKISQEEINTFVNAIMKDILNEIKQATNNKA